MHTESAINNQTLDTGAMKTLIINSLAIAPKNFKMQKPD